MYITYLRKKIDKNFDQPLLQTHIGMGYMLKRAAMKISTKIALWFNLCWYCWILTIAAPVVIDHHRKECTT